MLRIGIVIATVLALPACHHEQRTLPIASAPPIRTKAPPAAAQERQENTAVSTNISVDNDLLKGCHLKLDNTEKALLASGCCE